MKGERIKLFSDGIIVCLAGVQLCKCVCVASVITGSLIIIFNIHYYTYAPCTHVCGATRKWQIICFYFYVSY